MRTESPPRPDDALAALARFHRRGAADGPARTLAALAAEFVGLKRLLGHRYAKPAEHLDRAIAFLSARGVRFPAELTPAALAAYAVERRHVAPSTWRGIIDSLSVFADHLCALGRLDANPCALLRRSDRRLFRPYIFAREELARLFAVAPGRPTGTPRALVLRTIYAGALRRSEAVSLSMRHFDSAQGTLTIEGAKFGKSRLAPLSPPAHARLTAWIRAGRRGAGPDEPLFPNVAGRRMCANRLEKGFRRDLECAGIVYRSVIEEGVRHGPPCLHSLRHSFAVHRLLAWYREGVDVQAKLPLLSTFLGHSHIRHTQVYLTITRALLEEGRRRFAARWEKEFPLEP